MQVFIALQVAAECWKWQLQMDIATGRCHRPLQEVIAMGYWKGYEEWLLRMANVNSLQGDSFYSTFFLIYYTNIHNLDLKVNCFLSTVSCLQRWLPRPRAFWPDLLFALEPILWLRKGQRRNLKLGADWPWPHVLTLTRGAKNLRHFRTHGYTFSWAKKNSRQKPHLPHVCWPSWDTFYHVHKKIKWENFDWRPFSSQP